MAPTRTARAIEVGPYESRVGIRLTFDDDTAEVFLFDPATAATLFHQGLAVVETLRQVETSREQFPVSTASFSDHAKVRLVP